MMSTERCAAARDSMTVDADHAPSKTAPTARARIRMSSISDLDVDDLAEPEPADDGRDTGADDGDHAPGVIEQPFDVVGLQDVDDDADDERHQAQDHGAQAAFGGERTNLAPDAFALLHRVGHGFEQA